jgi:SAM-dependent methyltransferase
MTSFLTPTPRAAALAGLFALCIDGACAQGAAVDRAVCERDYKPYSGQQGKDVVWVPTPDAAVQRMLQIVNVTPQDIVYDLGAGDGKIAIAAARLGARAIGIEYNPDMARLAQCLVEAEKLTDRARIVRGDVFESDFREATVVTMYLLPRLNLRLLPKLLEDLKPGTRIVSHAFDMGDWKPEETVTVAGSTIHRWTIPAPGTPSYEAAMAAARAAASRR